MGQHRRKRLLKAKVRKKSMKGGSGTNVWAEISGGKYASHLLGVTQLYGEVEKTSKMDRRSGTCHENDLFVASNEAHACNDGFNDLAFAAFGPNVEESLVPLGVSTQFLI